MKSTKIKILALVMVFALLTLAACFNNAAPSSSIEPHQSESILPPFSSSKPESLLESEPIPSSEEEGSFRAFADELHDTYRDELVELLNQWLDEHRNGTFKEMPNHHPGYPSDFPPAANLPKIEELEDIVIVWKESVQIDANTETEGMVSIIVPIDEAHIYILDPATFSDEGSNVSIRFGYSGFADMSVEDYIAQTEAHFWPETKIPSTDHREEEYPMPDDADIKTPEYHE